MLIFAFDANNSVASLNCIFWNFAHYFSILCDFTIFFALIFRLFYPQCTTHFGNNTYNWIYSICCNKTSTVLSKSEKSGILSYKNPQKSTLFALKIRKKVHLCALKSAKIAILLGSLSKNQQIFAFCVISRNFLLHYFSIFGAHCCLAMLLLIQIWLIAVTF